MLSRDYRSTARNALRGNWGVSILVTLVAALLGGTGSSSSGSAGASGSSSTTQSNIAQLDSIPPVVLGIVITILSLLAIYALVTLIIGGAVRLGLISYNIDLVTKRQPPAFSTLFSRFSIFGKAFALNFMVSLFIGLWSLLLIIPGVVAAFRYAMAPYLLSENPDMGVMEAISLSKQMMKGNKFRLFKLRFSFIGWVILGCLTLGIGLLWVGPYSQAAEAAFYLDVSSKGAQNPEVLPTGPDIA